MSWKARAAAISVAWIVIPWTWSIVEEQARRRRPQPGSDGAAEPE